MAGARLLACLAPVTHAAGIANIEEVVRRGTNEVVTRRLNSDQSTEGRQLMLDPRQMRIYRVRLYAAPR